MDGSEFGRGFSISALSSPSAPAEWRTGCGAKQGRAEARSTAHSVSMECHWAGMSEKVITLGVVTERAGSDGRAGQ